ncbi:hypothetical protein LPMP_332760 [Leishmania panamensis]|uniref:LIM zinc-binding domain-containing protein n=2 Tax=Leishmania guyanensis species complex TaxID=38579 RepID=A0A088SIB7_LEIPA|nr:hypothetical protein LPMP_332760 [Leishmania panamensis]AIO01567.1 hypothetical protein LPMP_332760 [Leishmania panamensis]
MTTGDVQEDGTTASIDAALNNAIASAVKQDVDSDDVDNAASFMIAPSTSSLSSKGKKKSKDKLHSTAAAPIAGGVQYSSTITTGPKSTSAPYQPRLSSSSRSAHSGRQVIADAFKRTEPLLGGADGDYSSVYFPSGLSMNGQYKTIPEEYAEYRERNNVRCNYRGPVYVVENVCVPCNACGSPVDPVRRVPVGSLFFHETCLHCFLCRRRTGVAGLYLQVDRQAVCSECAARGYGSWVPRHEAQSRGMVYGAIRGDTYAAIEAHDRNVEQKQRRTAGRPITGGGASSTLNKATIPGVLPPSLAIANVHNHRNTSARSFALMKRQQYYTQSDNNMIMALPTSAARSPSATGGLQDITATRQYRIANGRHA